MKKFFLFAIFLFGISQASFASFDYIAGNVRSRTMVLATTAIVNGIDNIVVNPASIAGINKYEFNISYENLYRFIHSVSIAGGYGSSYGNLGLKYSELFVVGDHSDQDSIITENTRLQTERVVQLTYGLDFNDNIMIGTNVNFLYLEQKLIGVTDNNNIYYTADIGMIGKIYDRWFMGISITNITNTAINSSLNSERYYLTRKVSGGLTFKPYETLITSFDVSKISSQPTSFGFSVDYDLAKNLFSIYSGLRSFPTTFGLGFRLYIKKLSIDYGYSTVFNLPSRNHIQLSYTF